VLCGTPDKTLVSWILQLFKSVGNDYTRRKVTFQAFVNVTEIPHFCTFPDFLDIL